MTFSANYVRSLAVRLPVGIRAGLSLFLLLLPAALVARPMEAATYQEMFNKADFVAIAKPLSTKDTEERTTLPGWEYVHVVGVNTEFEAGLVLKGDRSIKNFVLHHYRLDKLLERLPIVDDPVLASFDSKQHNAYLLFLTKQLDGRYVPASGQVDPAAFSVIKLSSVTE